MSTWYNLEIVFVRYPQLQYRVWISIRSPLYNYNIEDNIWRYQYVHATVCVLLGLIGLLGYGSWYGCVASKRRNGVTIIGCIKFQKAQVYIRASTNNSFYQTLSLYYESRETVSRFGNTVYITFVGKHPEKHRLTRS
jgi:hypothetical protein